MITNTIEDENMLAEPTVEYVRSHSFKPIFETKEKSLKNSYANIKQPILEPDDDLRRAITIDELRDKMHKRIHELFAK